MATTTRRFAIAAAAAAVLASATLPASAYCLIGVRFPNNNNPASLRYNGNGKIATSVQCISSGTAMDTAVTSRIAAWSGELVYAGTTTANANVRDGINTVGWANLGGGTLGVTNFLSYDATRTVSACGGLWANLYEADVRITTAFRWATSGTGSEGCPCSDGSAFYLNAVAEHEFGHVIGLCHVNQPARLMYPSFGVCQNKVKGSDESNGEFAIYCGI